MASQDWLDKNLEFLLEKGFSLENIFFADKSDISKASSLSSIPDVIAVCKLPSVEKTLSDIGTLPEDYYLMLDGVQDPGNLGTIIRTAHWFGFYTIFASPQTVDCYNPKVVQSSMGSLAAVKVIYTDLCKLADSQPQLPLLGLQLKGSDLFNSPFPPYGFIVMGNEGSGLSKEMQDIISNSYVIPPYNKDNHSESLNVGVATAIVLAQIRK